MSFSTKLKKNHSYYTKVYILVSVDYQIDYVIGVVLTC